MWLKRWAEGRKGEDTMTVNQELDLAGRAENGRNLGRAISQTHLPFKISRCRSPDTLGRYIITYRITDRREIGSRTERTST
jgi:hypothetical protein